MLIDYFTPLYLWLWILNLCIKLTTLSLTSSTSFVYLYICYLPRGYTSRPWVPKTPFNFLIIIFGFVYIGRKFNIQCFTVWFQVVVVTFNWLRFDYCFWQFVRCIWCNIFFPFVSYLINSPRVNKKFYWVMNNLQCIQSSQYWPSVKMIEAHGSFPVICVYKVVHSEYGNPINGQRMINAHINSFFGSYLFFCAP